MTKQMRMRKAFNSVDDDMVMFVFMAIMVAGLILFVISAVASTVAGRTRVTVVSVQTSSDTIVERHKRGAYTHTYEYDATRYDLVLRKEDGTEVEETIVVKNDEYDGPWAETMFQVGNVLEYSNFEGFHYRYGLKLIE